MEGTQPAGPAAPAAATAPPPPPRSLDRLSWRPQPMVPWFDPVQLSDTAVRTVLSSVFGAYADKREVQAALSRGGDEPLFHDYSDAPDFWIDYASDLGDGFDSTYTVAWMLGQPGLPGPDPMAAGEERRGAEILAATRRGRVLILGGDQVYPTATRDEYENRFSGPYEAALPWAPPEERPRLFAVPGNHDWYDGLTSYMRLFCQQRWIGGWQTRQTRSYFALRLPQRWWLLGTDIQLESDIDKPQLDYFKQVARHMREGDRVILCTAEPTWVDVPEDGDAYDNLAFFERAVLCPRGARLMLTLAGDLHHYARYTDSTGERHKITAGGGGAYLYGTHLLPDAVELRKAEPEEPGRGRTPETRTYTREAVYPEPGVSRALRFGAWRLPFRNPRFALLLGILYSHYAWLLQGASRMSPDPEVRALGFIGWVGGQPLSAGVAVLQACLTSVFRSPSLVAFSLLFVVALWAFCSPDRGQSERERKVRRWVVGIVHGGAHLLLVLGLVWLISWLTLSVAGRGTVGGFGGTLLFGAVFSTLMVGLGGLLGSLLMAAALLPGVNFNEAYSAQQIEDYRNFVRVHISEKGALTVYPVGIDRVKRWEIDPEAQPGAPYFRPKDGSPPRARLIEEPITIPAPPAPRIKAHAVVKEEA
jgi:hypothetical protein